VANLIDKLLEYSGADREIPPLRPDPEAREQIYTIVSVDDHVLEPPDTFTGRMPAKFADRTPEVVRDEHGIDWWQLGDDRSPLLGADALTSWAAPDKFLGPLNFDEIRRAAWDIDERVRDMDLGGIAASLTFPSAPFGFAGQRFMRLPDQEYGLACMRAYNDWVIEDWAGRHPGRIIPQQVTWLPDVEVAAAEIRANAERGFKAVAFTENPEKLGLPSIHCGYWDPFFAACAETQTVVNLHVGSSSETLVPSTDSPPEVLGLLFSVNAFAACSDWLYAKVGVKFPDIRITLSESGIGWYAMLVDKIEYVMRTGSAWDEPSISPLELLHRNFWVSSFYDPRSFQLRDVVPLDRVMVESDYPHFDSSWPDTQVAMQRQLQHFTDDEVAQVTHRNALELYRHELPHS
jgi:predicted TIM-barrel fold metal-dependent hydrolase